MTNTSRKLSLLIWKNFILQIRRPIGTAVELLLPLAFIALLIFARSRISKTNKCLKTFDKEDIQYNSTNLYNYTAKLAKKEKIIVQDKLYLGYYPINSKTTSFLQDAIKDLPLVLADNFANSASLEDVLNEAKEYLDKYLGVITFDNVDDSNAWPKKVEYSIRLHHTTGKVYTGRGRTTWLTEMIYPYFIPPGARENTFYKSPFLSLQYYIDSAIIRMHTNQPSISAARYTQQFPFPDYIYDPFISIILSVLPLMMVLAFEYTAIMIVKELVAEKEFRLKESMKMMGLPNWMHWLAWFIKILTFSLIIIILITVLLKVGDVFKFTNGVVIFVCLTLFMLAAICFLFAISTLFSKGSTGMLWTAIIWFGSLGPYLSFQNPEKYEELSRQAKLGSCLLPNTCLGIMIQIIARYEDAQVGANWSNINETVTIDENFTLAYAFGMLVLDCFVFLLLTWYIENVHPGEYGVAKPFYFPFQISYWCRNTVSYDDSCDFGVELKENRGENFEDDPQGLEAGVSIKNIRKVFRGPTGKKIAVDDVSLNIYRGQITALLGHNGAGKTTLMSMLTGLFSPTNGSALISGKSILKEMDRIRDSLGICPQHNVLFDRLTVKEHLEFFSALKGNSKSSSENEIMALIKDINLLDKTHQRALTLSGGMKRKLNCAIALVGGSQIVFLDEPTSGMDPYARRATWDLLQRYRGNKTIILTTHFMDEADHLGDRIAIMAEGQIRCCGSSLFLKKRFGVGYHLTLVKSPDFEENRTLSLINEHVPTAKMSGNVAAELSYTLNEDSTKQFKPLFQKLEDEKDYYGITSFGVSVTTLEEVFLKVGDIAFEKTDSDIALVSNDEDCIIEKPDEFREYVEKSELMSGLSLKACQFRAMFVKRFLHFKRDRKAVVTQFIVPMILLLIGLVLSSSQSTQTDNPPRKLSLSMLKDKADNLVAFYGDVSSASQTDKVSLKNIASSYYSSLQLEFRDRSAHMGNISFENQGAKVSVLYSREPYAGNLSTDLTGCCDYQYLMINAKCNLTDPKSYCNTSEKSCSAQMPPKNGSHIALQEYILEDSAKKIKNYFNEKVAGLTVDDDKQAFTVWYSNQALHTLPSAFSAVSNIILQYSMNDKDYGIVTSNYPLPRNAQEKIVLASQNYGNTTLLIFLIFSICNLAASYVEFLVTEKISKAKHVQFVSGVNSLCYWGANYFWDITHYMLPGVVYIILFACFDLDDYSGDFGEIVLVIILFGVSVMPFVYLISFPFTSPLMAFAFIGNFGVFITLVMYISVFVCNLLDEKDAAEIMHYVFLLFPTYAFPQAMEDIAKNHGARRACLQSVASKAACQMREKKDGRAIYQEDTLSFKFPGIGLHCVYMFAESIVYFSLVLLIEENFFMGQLFSSSQINSQTTEAEDVDVKDERQKVYGMQTADIKKSALTMRDLTKVYRTTGMVAVDHLNVDIPKGECFGLLGINGAGKSTTFGMLTGELGISSGTAFLHGHNIKTELKEIQQIIGYCPQFDALIDKMTGREMIRMFAQLRGIPLHKIDDLVTAIIKKVNLDGWADKMCGNYSGGNKRKLSTAIALVGHPSVIFLDEPSSGMDPATRRQLWNTLTDVLSSGRSIILTSHSMEECEALCTRLVIMVNGKFKCIGSIQHLKSRFGQGYTVILKIDSNNNSPQTFGYNTNIGQQTNFAYAGNNLVAQTGNSIAQVKHFMDKQFPGCELLEEHQGLLQYHIDNRDIRWSQIFGMLEESATSLGVVDYSVSQTSLEQVFINFAKEQHSEESVKKKICCSCSCF